MKKTLIIPIIMGILLIILLITIFGNMSPAIGQSADELAFPNNCSSFAADSAGIRLRIDSRYSTTNCTNSSNAVIGSQPAITSLPLASLFARGSIVLLALMAAFLLLIIYLAWKVKKK